MFKILRVKIEILVRNIHPSTVQKFYLVGTFPGCFSLYSIVFRSVKKIYGHIHKNIGKYAIS